MDMTTFGAIVVTIAVATLYLMALKANARAEKLEMELKGYRGECPVSDPIRAFLVEPIERDRDFYAEFADALSAALDRQAERADRAEAALARIEATLGECVEAAEDDGPSSFAELVETAMPREFPDYVSDFQRETATDWCGDFQLVACRWRVADKGFHQTFGLNDLYRLAKTPNYWPDMFAANLAKVAE